MLSYADETPGGATGATVEVVVERGMSFPRVAELLHQRGIIESPTWFRLYTTYRGLATRIRSGAYTLRDDLTPQEVLDALVSGAVEKGVAVTFPEGLHMLEVFQRLEAAGVVSASELTSLARDPDFLASREIPANTLEGYLFPETYRFKVPTTAEVVLDTMLRQHRLVWERLRSRHEKRLADLKKAMGWTDHQVLIMASIVEKEAVRDSERPTIAQVFLNRLLSKSFRPKLLQTDPTIRYGCTVPVVRSAACQAWDPTKRLRRAQLDDAKNPYNTYQHEGMPPGPIANPGELSLEAVLTPDGSSYFYFVAQNDGSHAFARTIREHQRNVHKYQR